MNGMTCFWCGTALGRKHIAEDIVEGVTVYFHRGMFIDCKNNFLKWQREEQKRKQQRAQQDQARLHTAARQVH